jgi:hypothetical protein
MPYYGSFTSSRPSVLVKKVLAVCPCRLRGGLRQPPHPAPRPFHGFAVSALFHPPAFIAGFILLIISFLAIIAAS